MSFRPSSLVSRLLARFQRITTSGQFIPEIDGLRFIAIVAVAFFHINHYLLSANQFTYQAAGESFKSSLAVFESGARGVELFFAISGFILALPFANQYLKQGKAVPLAKFYARRVTRLEPPYLLAMTLCFLLLCYTRGYQEYLASFVASLFYSHNFIWPREVLPLVNPVAWSLEVEVQFYLIAPLVALIYKLARNPRRFLLILLILSKLMSPGFLFAHRSLIDYYEFFLMGFLLADLFVERQLDATDHEWGCMLGAGLAFAGMWFGPYSTLPWSIGLFIFCCFKSRWIRRPLGNRWITSIGGMCYSIYLIHWMLITTLGSRVIFQITNSYTIDFIIHTALLAVLILGAGAIYFQLIERPCMARDWPQRLFKRLKLFWHKAE